MQITISIENELYEKAISMSRPNIDNTELFREVLETYIRVQTAKKPYVKSDKLLDPIHK